MSWNNQDNDYDAATDHFMCKMQTSDEWIPYSANSSTKNQVKDLLEASKTREASNESAAAAAGQTGNASRPLDHKTSNQRTDEEDISASALPLGTGTLLHVIDRTSDTCRQDRAGYLSNEQLRFRLGSVERPTHCDIVNPFREFLRHGISLQRLPSLLLHPILRFPTSDA